MDSPDYRDCVNGSDEKGEIWASPEPSNLEFYVGLPP